MSTENLHLDSPFLVGHTSIDTAYEVKDYPYGFRLRTSIFYWIESKKGVGDRLGTYTINPKNGKPNKPKYGTYSTFMYLVKNEEGHVKAESIDSYEKEKFVYRFNFVVNKIGLMWINQIQRDNLRVNHYQHMRGNAPYELLRYSEEKKQVYREWISRVLHHIKTCPFELLTDYEERPEEDIN